MNERIYRADISQEHGIEAATSGMRLAHNSQKKIKKGMQHDTTNQTYDVNDDNNNNNDDDDNNDNKDTNKNNKNKSKSP